MADNTKLSQELWWRYQYLRDNGHLRYVKKAKKCEDFFAGRQWDIEDLEVLNQQRRPALTINKILPTLANIVGEQIQNRTEISFRPRRDGASEETAEALTRVFMQISDNNRLAWTRSDVYTDGLIGGRGFFDVRLVHNDSLQGEVQIRQLNPKNVMIDSEASSYDTEEWGDVVVSKWLTLDEIEMVYGKKWRSALELQSSEMYPYTYDEQDWERDQFGDPPNHGNYYVMDPGTMPMLKVVRVIERQWRKLDNREFFVHIPTADIRDIPDGWGRDEISFFLEQNQDYSVIRRTTPRIRWTVGAGREILHDEWSPYKHFTVVPFFPYFRRGDTIGAVENLLGPQELLNKVTSQELHVVNTTANSGWKIQADSLRNMDLAELEERGAETGLVLELEDIAHAEKIQPNNMPTGLDRISYKAEEHLKSIALVPDATTGFAREDVSAKALRANQIVASANYTAVQDNLNRTDHYLARNILDLVQTYYTEERLMYITTDPLRRKTEEFTVNQVTPEGEIINDLTLGEYDIVVTNQPERDTLEDSTFAQAVEMRKELGVQIPDSVLIQNSRLADKSKVIEAIEAQQNSPEAQQQRQLELEGQMAEVEKTRADAARDIADAENKRVKTQQDAINLKRPIDPDTQLRVEAELAANKYQTDTDAELKMREIESKERLAREEIESKERIARMTKQQKESNDGKGQ